MSRINLGHLLAGCIHSASRAARIIRQVRASGDLQIRNKGAAEGTDDPMTIADERAQRLIISALKSRWPDINIVGEEERQEDDELLAEQTPLPVDLFADNEIPADLRDVDIDDVCVFIDPLDATKEFTLGSVECVMTLIGIGYKGEPVGGVMHQPFVGDQDTNCNGRQIYALKGMGVHGVTPLQHNRDGQSVVMTHTRSHGSAGLSEAVARVAPSKVVTAGGCGYKTLLVIEGRADVYLQATPGTKKWDTCAPEAVLRELGGVMTDCRGEPLKYFRDTPVMNSHGLLAAMDSKLLNSIITKIKL